MFINFSNHPSDLWSDEQKAAANQYGDIVDVAFPRIPALSDEAEISALADEYVSIITDKAPACVLCQGEFTLVYSVIRRLQDVGVKVVAACSERITEAVTENGVSTKKVVFRFARFREYAVC